MLLHIVIIVLTLFLSCFTSLSDNVPPAIFVFGDSLLDVGNNNNLVSISKANFAPNGIDLDGPTGRFTNGRTVLDIVRQELGFKDFAPPFMDTAATATDLVLRGVVYASGGSGILNETGYMFGDRINMDRQVDNFAKTRSDIVSRIGLSAAQELLSKSLFSTAMGSNDFLCNYLVPLFSNPEQPLVPPEDFVGKLMAKYKIQLMRLFDLGARKIVVNNVGPIGCTPSMRDANPSAGGGCASRPNQLAKLFNSKLKVLVDELSKNLNGSNFLYADSYRIVEDILQNYTSYGFANIDSSCCYVAGRFGGLVPCVASSKICANRSKNFFWDPYHPSDAANIIIAKRLLDGNYYDISPKNIRQLVQGS